MTHVDERKVVLFFSNWKVLTALLLSVYLLLTVALPFTDLRDPLTPEEKDEVNSYALHIMVCIPCT